jgi:cysteinyl-tRNA synthetase
MEIVQKYTVGFHDVMEKFNTLPPSIEPTATGHIIEQIEMIKIIIANGYAYEANGSVYFDVEKYSREFNYGQLTNRLLEDLIANTRELGGQDEKKGRLDFALWIKAKPEHLMRWPSPWGGGFPGWHIECSAMSSKYLGQTFDIHGGGMDLAATHHTNEIAQSQACNHTQPSVLWMHTNMLTVKGTRMSKSAGNGFTPDELFTGNHPVLDKGYAPMAVKFFMMQAHYRSTLDFSNEALLAAEKGLAKLMNSFDRLKKLKPSSTTTVDIKSIQKQCYDAMNDDLNTAVVIAQLFEAIRIINSADAGTEKVTEEDIALLNKIYKDFVFDILGLKNEKGEDDSTDGLMQLILSIRSDAKTKKDFGTSDKIRDELSKLNFVIKDGKEGATWSKG